jgi:hypothetical protein
VGVAVGRQHLEDAVFNLQDRNVERAAAEVVDGNRSAVRPVETVCQRRGGRLVDDAQHLQAGEPPGVASGGALRVVEIRRHSDNRAVDFEVELALLAEVLFGPVLQFAQHERGNLRRGELAIGDADADDPARIATHAEGQHLRLVLHIVDAASHEALDRIDGPRCRGQQAALGFAPHEDRPVLADRHD